MEELFNLGQNSLEKADISLCIFPHIGEFMVIDMRSSNPQLVVLNTKDVFDDSFFDRIESAFSEALRKNIDHTFSHFLDLPIKLEELIRENGMIAILEHLGGKTINEDYPVISVFIITGAVLTMDYDQVQNALKALLGNQLDQPLLKQCMSQLNDLIEREYRVAKELSRNELEDALEDQSVNFFTLWDRSN